MHRLIRTSLVFGLAAVAVAATTVIPAHAAEGQQSRPTAQQFLFQPDLRVTHYLFSETSTVTSWSWKIENIGAADSGPITVKATCHGDAIAGTKLVVSKVIPALKAGQYTYLSYKCTGGQKYWVGTNVTVSTQDDLDPSNNTARWDND
jgi:hypothetical protein